MATMITTQDCSRTTARSPFAVLTSWFAELRARNTVLRELHQYSDRDLADLGITHGDFSSIAAGTYRRD